MPSVSLTGKTNDSPRNSGAAQSSKRPWRKSKTRRRTSRGEQTASTKDSSLEVASTELDEKTDELDQVSRTSGPSSDMQDARDDVKVRYVRDWDDRGRLNFGRRGLPATTSVTPSTGNLLAAKDTGFETLGSPSATLFQLTPLYSLSRAARSSAPGSVPAATSLRFTLRRRAPAVTLQDVGAARLALRPSVRRRSRAATSSRGRCVRARFPWIERPHHTHQVWLAAAGELARWSATIR